MPPPKRSLRSLNLKSLAQGTVCNTSSSSSRPVADEPRRRDIKVF